MARYEYLNVTNLRLGQAQGKGTLTIGDKSSTNYLYVGTGASSTSTVTIGSGTSATATMQIGGTAATFTMGTFASTAGGSGIKMYSSRTSVMRIYADDGAVSLTASGDKDYKAFISRMLISTAITTANITVTAAQGHLKIGAVAVSSTSILSGVRGYVEVVAAADISTVAGVRSSVEIPATATLTGTASAFCADSLTINCTHTGKAALIHALAPEAGTWDYFCKLGTGCGWEAKATALNGLTSADRLIIDLNGTVGYIPVMTSWS